jgi:hypothetical protein
VYYGIVVGSAGIYYEKAKRHWVPNRTDKPTVHVTNGALLLAVTDANMHAGTFASSWQRTYAGLVPKNSLFSFFQRLGMVKWHWVLV